MGHLIVPALGLVLSIAVGVGRGLLRRRWARRAASRVAAGRPVVLPALGGREERERPGRLFADSGGLRFLTGGRRPGLLVPEGGFGPGDVARWQLSGEEMEMRRLRAFTGPDGTAYRLGVPAEYDEALTALAARPPRPARWTTLLRAALPVSAVSIALVVALGSVAFQALWWSGHDVRATVTHVAATDGGGDCAVRWADAGDREHATVDCPEALPHAGDPLPVRALATPFRGQAMDTTGTFDALGLALPALGGLSLLVGGVVAGWRLRRRPLVRLTPVQSDGGAAGTPQPAGARDVVGLSFQALALAAAAKEGWPDPDPSAVTDGATGKAWRRDLHLAWIATGGLRIAAVVASVAAVLFDSLPRPVTVGLALVAAAFLVLKLWRTAGLFKHLRAAWREPFTSEWEFVAVRTVEGERGVFLLLGDTPHWTVFVDGVPPLNGRLAVRGPLQEGGAVHLRVGDDLWLTTGPVLRVDEDMLADVREMLAFAVSGEWPEQTNTVRV